MAKAYKAPPSNYHRTYGVTEHVLLRFREYAVSKENDFVFRDDDDLSNWIDAIASDSVAAGKMERVYDEGVECLLIDVSEYADNLYILAKPNTSKYRSACPYALVTVMSGEQVARRKSAPNSNWVYRGSPGAPLQSMSEKLAALHIVPAKSAVPLPSVPHVQIRKAAPAAPAAPPPPTFSTAEVEQTAIPAGPAHKVTWLEQEGDVVEEKFEICRDKEQALKIVEELVNEGCSMDDITVYRQEWVPLKKKVRVELV